MTCLPIAAWTWPMPWPIRPAPATKTCSIAIAPSLPVARRDLRRGCGRRLPGAADQKVGGTRGGDQRGDEERGRIARARRDQAERRRRQAECDVQEHACGPDHGAALVGWHALDRHRDDRRERERDAATEDDRRDPQPELGRI